MQHRLQITLRCPRACHPLEPCSCDASLTGVGGACWSSGFDDAVASAKSSIWSDLDNASWSDSVPSSPSTVAGVWHCRMHTKHVRSPQPWQSANESRCDFLVGFRWQTWHGASKGLAPLRSSTPWCGEESDVFRRRRGCVSGSVWLESVVRIRGRFERGTIFRGREAGWS